MTCSPSAGVERRQGLDRVGGHGGNVAGERRVAVVSVTVQGRALEAELFLEHVGDVVEECVRLRFVDLDQILTLHVPRSEIGVPRVACAGVRVDAMRQ